MNLIRSSFKESIKSFPFVLKKVNLYFASYYLVLNFALLYLCQHLFPFASDLLSSILQASAKLFLVFIVPYYTYKHKKGPKIQPFWDFIKTNVWPLFWAHTKAFFVILLFLLLLIFPGLYKAIRYIFVTETCFFDKNYKEKGLSVLKEAQKVTYGYFWLLCLISACFVFTSIAMPFLLKLLPLPSYFRLFINFTLVFYTACFLYLFRTELYFQIKEKKGEELSC